MTKFEIKVFITPAKRRVTKEGRQSHGRVSVCGFAGRVSFPA